MFEGEHKMVQSQNANKTMLLHITYHLGESFITHFHLYIQTNIDVEDICVRNVFCVYMSILTHSQKHADEQIFIVQCNSACIVSLE
jgi:hypothetical protein